MNGIYFRVRRHDSTLICFRRAGLGQPARKFNAEAQAGAVQLAYTICTLAPEAADKLLRLPSQRVGRVVKAALRRAQIRARRRARSRRRPTARVIRA